MFHKNSPTIKYSLFSKDTACSRVLYTYITFHQLCGRTKKLTHRPVNKVGLKVNKNNQNSSLH
jgi:hypothetical protein